MKQLFILYMYLIYMQCFDGEICGPMNIVSKIHKMELFKNCTVILGNVKIILIDHATPEEWANMSLPRLREITDNIVLYRVFGLQSLGTIFPNLSVIRGFKLAFDYAMILYENTNLTEVALPALTTILRGYVRIEKNEELCYSRSVNWDEITKVRGNVIERDNLHCPPSKTMCDHCPDKRCWNKKYCFKSDVDRDCHELCLGGCFLPNNATACTSCKKYNLYGTCVKKCPDKTFTYDNYFCLSEEHCLNKKRFLFKTSCVEDCPPNFKRVKNNNYCEECLDGPCSSSCSDNHLLIDMSTIEKVKGCRIINGTLEIRHIQSEQTLKELYEALNMLELVVGGLIIQRNYFSSLYFLPNLTAIHGVDINSNYSISVMDNPNLETLFNWTSVGNLTIKGKLFFHYNPKLCLAEIEKLRQSANLQYNFTILEISRSSNGDKVECGFDPINSTHKVISSTSVEITWHPYHPPKTHSIFGYQVFYAPSELVNPSRVRVAEVCQDTIWKEESLFLHDIKDYNHSTFSIMLENLNPYSNYSYYVASVLIENSTTSETIEDVGAQSEVFHFQTLPDQPGRPRRVRAFNISYSEIKLKWKPPSQPNGKLNKYVITAYLQQFEHKNIDQRNYCLAPKIPDHEQTQGFYTGNNDDCESTDQITFVLCGNQCNDPKDEDRTGCDNFDSKMDYLIDSSQPKTINSNPFSDLDLKKRDVTTYENVKEQMKRLKTGEYEIFNATIGATQEELIMNNLLHYSMYKIYISACNEQYCSTVAMVTQRTSAKPNADDITELIANKDKDTIILFWHEPLHPNSIILYYNIEIKTLDDSSQKWVIVTKLCITRVQHVKNDFVYKIPHLEQSTYVIRVRATSLYANGNWTEKIIISSWEWKLYNTYTILLATIIIIILILICIIIYKWNRDKKLLFRSGDNERHHLIRKDIKFYYKMHDLENDEFLYGGSFCGTPCLLKVSTGEEVPFYDDYKNNFFDDINILMSFSNEYVLKVLGTISNSLPFIIVFENVHDVLSEYLKNCFTHEVLIPHKFMFQWTTEIADGMAYLSAKNYVHGDISTKNILIVNNFTVKISKFGLGRGLVPDDYITLKDTLSPLRWTSKELLLNPNKRPSTKSDIWSYGVFLWEIANCCRVDKPYSEVSDSDLLRYLENGGTLEVPDSMPKILAKIMIKCFRNENRRPSFKNIVLLDISTCNDFHENSFVFSEYDSSKTSIQMNYATPSTSVSFNKQCDECSDELFLINNEIENNEQSSVGYLHQVIAKSHRSRLNNYFQISSDDWDEWSRAKLDSEALTFWS